jgi:VIT1/CCC1 family predicted Fe2+/Mn2+ transporter
MIKQTELYLRNVIFGVADSLVSTVGLLAGIDVAGTTRSIIVLTGVVYAFVEAFSMAVGSFLSEESAEQYKAKGEVREAGPLTGSIVMFFSFIVASFIPIVPYLLFGLTEALWVSIIFSLIALFVVGMVSAQITKVTVLSHALKMALLGGAAILIGVIVGKFIKAG